jgi:hypothetical protein
MTAIGTWVTPHASSSGEWGNEIWPICFPGRSKSIVVKAELGRFPEIVVMFIS